MRKLFPPSLPPEVNLNGFPSTRYQGSKARVRQWMYGVLSPLRFDTALDAFGGTGTVSFLLKKMGKRVTYNDYLRSNYFAGLAVIQNPSIRLEEDDFRFIMKRHTTIRYPTFIQDTFEGIYYTESEDAWLDQVVTNIRYLSDVYVGPTLEYKRALAYHVLNQSCLMKRPFNLFHRRNLYLRTADVKRKFGNKTTWDTAFADLFLRIAIEVNAAVFDNHRQNISLNFDAMALDAGHDLVYLDIPYLRVNGSDAASDYHSLYHFLDGLCRYQEWPKILDANYAHKPLKRVSNPWNDKSQVHSALEVFIQKHSKSTIVLSYRDPGVPSRQEIREIMAQHKRTVCIHERQHAYALNRQNGKAGQNIELLFVGI